MAIDYTLHQGETIDQYNARIAAARATQTSTPTSVTAPTSTFTPSLAYSAPSNTMTTLATTTPTTTPTFTAPTTATAPTATATAPASAPPPASTVPDYTLHPGETITQYNARVQQYYSKPAATSPTTTPTPTSTPTSTPQTNLQKSVLSAVADIAANSSTVGNIPLTFADALKRVQSDPNLMVRYADDLKLDTQSFALALQQLQDSTSREAQRLQTQFENERKQLSEQSAAAGQAYSGFRGKAEQQLQTSESGIVQSTRSQIQKNLQDLTSQFEGKYGSVRTPMASTQFTNPFTGSNIGVSGLYQPGTGGQTTLSGVQAGGIAGSIANQSADRLQQASATLQPFPQI